MTTQYPVTPVSGSAGMPVSYAPVQAQSTNAPGLLSFIAGLLGIAVNCIPWCGCAIGGLLSITAIILGVIGLQQIKANPERYTGRGLAVAGLALGIAVILLEIVVVIVLIVFAANHP